MDRRWNLLFAIPLLTALVAFLLTERLVFTALGFIVGYVLMEGLRFLFLPPHLHKAVQHYQRGELESALELTEQSFTERPERWEPYYLRALIYFALSQLEDAEESIRKALSLNEKGDSIHTTLGQILYAQTRFEEAEKAFAEAVRLKGREGLNQYHLGATVYRLERYSEAAPRLELATRLGIDNPQLTLLAYYYLGRSLEQLGREDEAAAAYENMAKSRDALDALRRDINSVPDYPALPLLQRDVAAIRTRLPQVQ